MGNQYNKIFDQFSDLPNITKVQRYRLRHPNKNKEYYLNHQEYYKKKSNQFSKKHPKIKNAQHLAERKVPLGKMCQFGNCDAVEHLQRCHLDYDFPLLVITMCAKHHNLVDYYYREID